MRIFKRVLAFVLVISMLMSTGITAVAAEESLPTLTAGSGVLQKGGQVVIPFSISNNPTIGAANIQIVYDSDNLQIDLITAVSSTFSSMS